MPPVFFVMVLATLLSHLLGHSPEMYWVPIVWQVFCKAGGYKDEKEQCLPFRSLQFSKETDMQTISFIINPIARIKYV